VIMAIGINLGTDEDRAMRAAEDAEMVNDFLKRELDDKHRSLELTKLALSAVIEIGEGIVLDGHLIKTDFGMKLIPEHRWFYMSRHTDGVRAYAITNSQNLPHGTRLKRKPK
jgi:hypothetical protein